MIKTIPKKKKCKKAKWLSDKALQIAVKRREAKGKREKFEIGVVSVEKEMATHSSILVWRIPQTEEPGRLQSMRSQKVKHG